MQSYFEMVHRGIGSVTVQWTWLRSQLEIDDSWFDGSPVGRFVIVAKNDDSADRDIDLLDSGGSVLDTITIPSGTSAYTLFISASTFSLQSGDSAYRIRTEATTANYDVELMSAGFYVEQLNTATKSAYHIQLCTSRAQGALAGDNAGYIYASNPTSFAVQDPKIAAWFQKDVSRWQDTIDGWRFYANLRTTTGVNTSRARLYNYDNAAAVAGTEISTSSTTITFCKADIADGATDFDDLDDFLVEWKSSNGLNQVQLFGAGIIVKVSDISSVEAWFPVTHAIAFSSTVKVVSHRKKFDNSGVSEAYFHTFGYLEGTATGEADLFDGGTNDSGTGGSSISQLSFTGSDKYNRSSNILSSLTDDNRYYFQGARPTGGVLDDFEVQSAYLVLVYGSTVNFNVADSMNFWSDSGSDLSQVPFLTFSGSDNMAFWGDVAVLTPAVHMLVSGGDSMNYFSDDASLGVWSRIHISGSGSMSFWQDSGAFGIAKRFGPDPLVLSNIDIDDPLYVSSVDVRHPTRFYDGIVESFGIIDRSIPVPSGMPRLSDQRISVIDTDQTVRKRFAGKTPVGDIVTTKIGQEETSESLFATVFTGRIDKPSFDPGRVHINISDITFEWLKEDVPGLINSDNFNNLPEETEVFAPFVFGDTNAQTGEGAIELFCVDNVNNYWGGIRHSMFEVSEVYIKGSSEETATALSGAGYTFDADVEGVGGQHLSYTVVEEDKTIDDVTYTFTYIKFNLTIPNGFSIRMDGKGLKDDDGNLEQNPVRCIYKVLKDFNTPFDVNTDFDVAIINAEAAELDTLGWLCDGAQVEGMTYNEFLTRMLQSHNLMLYQTKYGDIAIKHIDQTSTDRPIFDDTFRILEKTVNIEFPPNPINKLIGHYSRNYVTGKWDLKSTYNNTIDQTALGEIVKDDFEMWFVRDATTAAEVVQEKSEFLDLNSFVVTFETPLVETIDLYDLGDPIGITHYGGLNTDGGGWTNEEFIVTQIVHDLDRLKTRISCVHRVTIDTPVAAALTDVQWTKNLITGPWVGQSAGSLYGVFKSISDPKKIKVVSSLNYGKTWSEPDPNNFEQLTNIVVSADSFVVRDGGNKIHTVTQEGATGRVAYHRFDMVEGVWDIVNEEILASTTATVYSVSIAVSVPSGKIYVFYSGDTVSGGERGYYQMRIGAGDWGDNQGNSGVETLMTTGGSYSTKRPHRVIPGGNDRMHFHYAVRGAFRIEYHNTLRSDGSTSGGIAWCGGQLTYYAVQTVNNNVGKYGWHVDDDGNVSYGFVWKAWFGEPRYVSWASADTLPSNPVWRNINGSFIWEGNSNATAGSGYPSGSYYIDKDSPNTARLVIANFPNLAVSNWESYWKAGDTGQGPYAPQCGFKLPGGSTMQNSNASFFTQNGKVYLVKFSGSDNGTYPVIFQFLSVENDVPQASDYYLSDLLTELGL